LYFWNKKNLTPEELKEDINEKTRAQLWRTFQKIEGSSRKETKEPKKIF